MNKNKFFAIVLGILGAVLVIGGLYFTISYLNSLGQGVIDFVSVNNVNTISRCGIVVPEQFIQFRNQFATVILPMLYLGIPLVVILISVIMFFSGYYFGKSRFEEDIGREVRKQKEIEEEVNKRVGEKKPKSTREEAEGKPVREEVPKETAEEEPMPKGKPRRR